MKARNLPLILTLILSTLFSSLTQYSYSQTPKYIVFPGEYNCFIMPTATSKIYDVAQGLPSLVGGQPSAVTQVSANLHHFGLIDNAGNAYFWGDNAYGEVGNGAIGGSVSQPTK